MSGNALGRERLTNYHAKSAVISSLRTGRSIPLRARSLSCRRTLGVVAISFIVVFASCAIVTPHQVPLSNARRSGNPSQASPMVIALPASRPGESNGETAYLNQSSDEGLVSDVITCVGDPFSEISFKASTHFGLPPLTVSYSLETSCGIAPFSGTWTFGDGNSSTQDLPNATIQVYPVSYSWWNYTHVYHYIGAFIASMSVTDDVGKRVSDSSNEYASFVPSLYYSFYNASALLASGVTGSKYSIGLVDECDSSVSNATLQTDLNKFDSEFSLPSLTLNLIWSGGKCTSRPTNYANWDLEVSLDIEWAHVAAPGAKIYVCLDTTFTQSGLVNCDKLFYNDRSSLGTMLVSNSWGWCASGLATCTDNTDTYSSTYDSARSAGMTVIASSGDNLGCTCVCAQYPSSDLSVLSVGGTTITAVPGTGTYGSETDWANYSWTTGSCHAAYRGLIFSTILGETAGMNPYYGAPSWQASVLSNSSRYAPDVSMVGNESTGVPLVSQGLWYIGGGTSAGAPIWAGIIDMLFNASAPRLTGFAPTFLYNETSCFHSIAAAEGNYRDALGTPNIGCLAKA